MDNIRKGYAVHVNRKTTLLYMAIYFYSPHSWNHSSVYLGFKLTQLNWANETLKVSQQSK